jgi:undecaprenyl-diphosphatase
VRLTLPTWVDDIDEAVDEQWETIRGIPAVDRVFYAASAAGDFSVIWHAINLIRLASAPHDRYRFVRLAAALGVESVLINQGVKRLFERDRPEDAQERPHHLRSPTTSSFPSGHASSAAMAALLLSERSRFGPLYGAIAAVVATSRLHVRIHHASDVVAGALLGAVGAVLWKRVWPLR